MYLIERHNYREAASLEKQYIPKLNVHNNNSSLLDIFHLSNTALSKKLILKNKTINGNRNLIQVSTNQLPVMFTAFMLKQK